MLSTLTGSLAKCSCPGHVFLLTLVIYDVSLKDCWLACFLIPFRTVRELLKQLSWWPRVLGTPTPVSPVIDGTVGTVCLLLMD